MQPIGASVLAVTCVHRVCTALMPLGATWQLTVPFLAVGGGGRQRQTAASVPWGICAGRGWEYVEAICHCVWVQVDESSGLRKRFQK